MTPQDQEAVERLTKLANTEIDQHNGRPWPLGPLEMVQHTADLRHLLALSQGWKPDRAALAVRLGSFPMQDEDLGPDNEVLIDLLPRSPADDQPGETMLYRLVDAILALTAPKDEGWRPDRTEQGWLIELWHAKTDTYTARWWDGCTLDWTRDSASALRFARAQDAQTYIDDIGWTDAKPTEHAWSLPTSPTQSAGGTET